MLSIYFVNLFKEVLAKEELFNVFLNMFFFIDL